MEGKAVLAINHSAIQRVVVVDDDEPFLELVQDVLEDEHYQVETFTEINGAYQAIRTSAPSLIVTDLLFSNMLDGLDLLTRLWLTPATRSIPVLVCSAATNQLQCLRPELERKGIGVLYKPFELHDLLLSVHTLIAT